MEQSRREEIQPVASTSRLTQDCHDTAAAAAAAASSNSTPRPSRYLPPRSDLVTTLSPQRDGPRSNGSTPVESLALRRYRAAAASRPPVGMRRRSKSADSATDLLRDGLNTDRSLASPTRSTGIDGSAASAPPTRPRSPSNPLTRSSSADSPTSEGRSIVAGLFGTRTKGAALPSPSLGRLPPRTVHRAAASVSSPPSATSRSYAPTIPSPLAHSTTGEFPFPVPPMHVPSGRSIHEMDTTSPTRAPLELASSPPLLSGMIKHQSRSHMISSPISGRARSRSGEHYIAESSPPNHWRSASSASSRSASQDHDRSPLTPPESLGTGRHLSSAADLAWNDVLGGIGTLNFAGVDFAASVAMANGTGTDSASRSSIPHVHDLMALENGGELSGRRMSGSRPGGESSQPLGRSERRSTPTEQGKWQRVGNEELMLGSGGGHFGPATRERLALLIEKHLPRVPLHKEDKLVHLVEYGALNSRSAILMPAVISQLALRHADLGQSGPHREEDLHSSLSPVSALSFQVTHADRLDSDFRALSKNLDQGPESYLNANWLSSHVPSLESRVFSSFSSRPFASKVFPEGTVSFGFSAMALHWLSTDRKTRIPPATLAHAELMAFLSARASEFKPGGLLVMAYISRSERDHAPTHSATSSAGSSPNPGLPNSGLERGVSLNGLQTTKHHAESLPVTPIDGCSSGSISSLGVPAGGNAVPERPEPRERASSSPNVPGVARRRDIWDVLSGLLGKAIQPLVSTQLLKPAVARQLLALPIHPRSVKQTQAVLRSPAMQHSWLVEEQETLVLPHPAWVGLEHNTVSPASYADHTLQLLKIFWESEIRTVLREASMSRSASEYILDSLWDIAREKAEEEGPQPLELEVQMVALRRRCGVTAAR